MRKQRHAVLALLGLGLAGSAMAIAGVGSHNGGGKFMQFFDSNQDGSVTLEEFKEAAENRFTQMDIDKNGSLSADEFYSYVQGRRAEHRQQRYTDIDSDRDGQISKEEFLLHKRRQAEERFAIIDKNGDGLVSSEEFNSCRMKARGGYGGKRIFQSLDANKDGVISREEGLNAWTNWFNSLDANKDQVVTKYEVDQARANR